METVPFARRSEQVNELMTALAKAKRSFKPILKLVKAGGDKRPYMYATLDEIVASTSEALSENGLVLSDDIDNGQLTVTLDHAPSGQWKRSRLPLPDPLVVGWQNFGSATTYARRYLYSPMTGTASQEDDDGAAADAAKRGQGAGQADLDPMQPLWDALEAKGIGLGQPTREWIEMVLAHPCPTPSCISPAEVTQLISVATGKAPMPQPHLHASPSAQGAQQASAAPDKIDELRKQLNGELNNLAPWGHALDDMGQAERAKAKQTAKLAWANGLLPNTRTTIKGFGELTEAELVKLIGCAKAGEMPVTDDDVPDMTTTGGLK